MHTKYKPLAALSLVVFILPIVASAQTMATAQLQAEIQSLLAQVQSLQQQLAIAQGGSSAAWCHVFGANLEVGNTSPDVTALQQALSKDGESASITGTFDEETASAVTGFQQKYTSEILTPNGLQNGTGYVGRATRAKLNSLFGCGPAPIVPAPTPMTLSVSVDPNVVMQAKSVNPGGTGYVLVAANLTAGPSADVTVSSINFGCGGYACNQVTNLRMIGVGPVTQTWTGSSLNAQVFTPNLVIPAGTTQAVELVGDVPANAATGQEMAWALTSNLVTLSSPANYNVTGGAFGNYLVLGSWGNQSVSLTVNGSTGPVTVSSGALLTFVWGSTGIPYTCTVSAAPTEAGTYNIAEGLSGTATANAPTVSVLTSYYYEVSCPTSGTGGPSIATTVQVTITPGTTSQATFSASQNTVASGGTVTFSWSNAAAASALTNFFGTTSCVSGIMMYDVTNNQNFLCGDVDRPVSPSGSDTIKFTSTNPSAIQMPFVLQYGNGQSLGQAITINPTTLYNPLPFYHSL